jgi:hypothetical protein
LTKQHRQAGGKDGGEKMHQRKQEEMGVCPGGKETMYWTAGWKNHDGESTQKRKNKANLDGVKSNSKSYNPFSILTNSKISNVARIVGVQIGQDAKSKVSSLAKIQESDASRAEIFSDACVSCQGDSLSNEVDLVEVRNAEVGGEYGSTTHEQNPRPQLEDRSGPHGRWTCVVNSQN